MSSLYKRHSQDLFSISVGFDKPVICLLSFFIYSYSFPNREDSTHESEREYHFIVTGSHFTYFSSIDIIALKTKYLMSVVLDKIRFITTIVDLWFENVEYCMYVKIILLFIMLIYIIMNTTVHVCMSSVITEYWEGAQGSTHRAAQHVLGWWIEGLSGHSTIILIVDQSGILLEECRLLDYIYVLSLLWIVKKYAHCSYTLWDSSYFFKWQLNFYAKLVFLNFCQSTRILE